MALLRLHPKRRAAGAFFLGAALLALAGCVLIQGKRSVRRDFAFTHRAHVEQELGCTDCHLAAETSDEPGLPGQGACNLCHAELDKDKPADRKVAALYEGKQFKAVRHTAVGGDVIFPHLRHVAAGLECSACHTGIETNEDVLELGPVSMDTCMDCHARKGASNDCATCHREIRSDVRPPSHDGNWTRLHGGICRADLDEGANRCSMCHQESSCATCHLTTPPANHTQQWRRVGHGVAASLDRASCQTCHQPATCATCHAETTPRNHVGNFGSPRNMHCLTCHEPLAGESCSACHASAPSHALATPKPASHNPAMNCRQCHLPGGTNPPMPHVDDGSNCNRCHP